MPLVQLRLCSKYQDVQGHRAILPQSKRVNPAIPTFHIAPCIHGHSLANSVVTENLRKLDSVLPVLTWSMTGPVSSRIGLTQELKSPQKPGFFISLDSPAPVSLGYPLP